MLKIQYDEKTDPIVYGRLTDGFNQVDWLHLAFAALDQACFKEADRLADQVKFLIDCSKDPAETGDER